MTVLLPLSIQIFHIFENHEHEFCVSKSDYHIHKKELDCEGFHKLIPVFLSDFSSNYDVIPTHFYTTIFLKEAQISERIIVSKKKTRGPPNFTEFAMGS